MSEHAFSSVICRDDARQVHRPSDRDVNWMSPVQGKSPPVQVEEPYGNFDMVTCTGRGKIFIYRYTMNL